MMMPEPAAFSLFDHIIDELNLLSEKNLPQNDFAFIKGLAKLNEKIQKLKSLDLALGFSAEGSLHCLKGNLVDMHRCHKNSLEYKRIAITYKNYAVSLYLSDLFDDAFAYGKIAYDFDQTDLGYLYDLIVYCIALNNEEQVNRYLEVWGKLTDKPHTEAKLYFEAKEEYKELTSLCASTTIESLAHIWDTPGEDEAWAHLQ